MTTTKDLIQYLQTLPEDTIVQVVVADRKGYAYTVELDLLDCEHSEYTNFSNNQYTDENCLWYNKRYLTLGSS